MGANTIAPSVTLQFVVRSLGSTCQGNTAAQQLNACCGSPYSESGRGKSFCGVCDKHIPDALWASHPKSQEHRRKEGYTAFKVSLEEAEKDKHGVTLSEGLDFGIIESADAARGVSQTLTIETTVPSSRVTIKNISLSSSFTGTQSP